MNTSSNIPHLNLPNNFYVNGRFIHTAIAHNGTLSKPEANSHRREVGDLAVWTLSSAKLGNGVEQLRDDNINTFWQ